MADSWCGEALGGRGRRAPRLHHHQQRLEQGDEEDFYDHFIFLHPRLPRLAGSPPDDWMRGGDAKQEGNQHRGKQLFTD